MVLSLVVMVMDVDVVPASAATTAVSGLSYYYFSAVTTAPFLVVTAADVTLAVDVSFITTKGECNNTPSFIVILRFSPF